MYLEPKEETRPSEVASISVVMLQPHFQELRRQKDSWQFFVVVLLFLFCSAQLWQTSSEQTPTPLMLISTASSWHPTMSSSLKYFFFPSCMSQNLCLAKSTGICSWQVIASWLFPALWRWIQLVPQAAGRWDIQALVVSVGQELSSKDAIRTAIMFFRRNLL